MQLRPGFWNVIDKLSNFGKITLPNEIKDMASAIQVFDEEKYLPPIDVSTNLFYYKGTLFGGIYDDRFLVKKVETNEKYHMKEEIPYEKAKPMYYVEDIEEEEKLKNIIMDTYKGLKSR